MNWMQIKYGETPLGYSNVPFIVYTIWQVYTNLFYKQRSQTELSPQKDDNKY